MVHKSKTFLRLYGDNNMIEETSEIIVILDN